MNTSKMDFKDRSGWAKAEKRSASQALRTAARLGRAFRGRPRASRFHGAGKRAGRLQACTHKSHKGAAGAAVPYITRPRDARLITTNMVSRDAKGWVKELAAAAARRPGLKKTDLHFSLNFNPLAPRKSPEFLEKFVIAQLRRMGFQNADAQLCDFVAVEHPGAQEGGHQHVHIVVSRIQPGLGADGRTGVVSLSNDFYRFRSALRDTEREFGLVPIDVQPTEKLSQNDTQIRAQKRGERLGQNPNYLDAHTIHQALAESPSFKIFSQKLQDAGIRVKPAARRTDGVSVGILFQRIGAAETDWLAGSSVDRSLSLNAIKKTIAANAQRLLEQQQLAQRQHLAQQAQQQQIQRPRERF